MNLIFLSINTNFVKHIQDNVECISLDFVCVSGHLIGYEDIGNGQPSLVNTV